MRRLMMGAAVAVALAGCGPTGPTAQQVRACEMYTDTGGTALIPGESAQYGVVLSEMSLRRTQIQSRLDDAEILRRQAEQVKRSAGTVDGIRAAGAMSIKAINDKAQAQIDALDVEKDELVSPILRNGRARASVSQRLSISLNEVERALDACWGEKKKK
jgi:hypothetical protein